MQQLVIRKKVQNEEIAKTIFDQVNSNKELAHQ